MNQCKRKMRLTAEKLVFVVVNYQRTQKRLNLVKEQRFPKRNPTTSRTINENVRKYSQHGENLSLNKGKSGRHVTVRVFKISV